jgi:LysM repeat protein
MKRTLKLTESEKNRILGMYKSNLSNYHIVEQRMEYDETLYKVKDGDTLEKIANELGITLDDLFKYNPNFKENQNISTGNYLSIPIDILPDKSKSSLLVSGYDENKKSWDEVKDLKIELLSQLKSKIQSLESKPDVDLCETFVSIHFELTNFYNNPFVRKKGWDPMECSNYNELDSLMKPE